VKPDRGFEVASSDDEHGRESPIAVDSGQPELDDRRLEKAIECVCGQLKTKRRCIPAAKQKAKSNDSATADSVWQRFGMRLEEIKLEAFERICGRYRGGMKVVAVRPDGPAARQGIRKGDILVGLHIWETVNDDDLIFILASDVVRENKLMKFYILRDDETLYGHFPPAG